MDDQLRADGSGSGSNPRVKNEQRETPFKRMSGALNRLHGISSWPGRVYNDEFGGETDRGTAEWIEDTEGTPTQIRVEWATQATSSSTGGAGRLVQGDCLIRVSASGPPVYDGSEGSQQRASVIEDERNGKRYRVLRILDQNDGLLICDCEVMTE